MSAFLAAAVVVGTAIQMYSSSQEAKAKQNAANAAARAKRIQANELLDRFFLNRDAMTLEAQAFQGSQIGAFAKSDIELGSGTSMLALETTNKRLLRQLEIDQKEAEFKARQLRIGADIDVQLGSDIRRAQKSKNASIFLNGATSVAKSSGSV